MPRELVRERKHDDEQRPAVGERVELLVVRREQHRRRRRIDDLERMRAEGDEQARAGRLPPRARCTRAKNVAMAEVDAVERADGDDRSAASCGRPTRRQASRKHQLRVAARRRAARRRR